MMTIVECDSSQLAAALVALNKAVGRPGPMVSPQLRVDIADGSMALTRSSLTTVVQRNLPAGHVSAAAFAVPARPLQDLALLVPHSSVKLSTSKNQLEVTIGTFQATINAAPEPDFEVPLESAISSSVSVAAADLGVAAERVGIARVQDENHPTLSGIAVSAAAGELTLSATDGTRAALAVIAAEVASPLPATIVPGRILEEMREVLSEGEEIQIHVSVKPDLMRVSSVSGWIQTALLAGKFPAFDSMVPAGQPAVALVNREDLILALRECQIFAPVSNRVTLQTAERSINIIGESSEYGRGETTLAASITGASGGASVSGEHLLAVLPVIPGSEVRLDFHSGVKRLVIRPAGELAYWCAMNPIAAPPEGPPQSKDTSSVNTI